MGPPRSGWVVTPSTTVHVGWLYSTCIFTGCPLVTQYVSLAHNGITAWEPPRGAGWLSPVLMYMWVGCTVHVSLLGALWAPSTSLSLVVGS